MQRHVPVLAKEIYENLPENLNTYFDGTLGHGWHVEYILSKLEEAKSIDNIKVLWVDRDELILKKSQELLNKYKNKIFFLHSSYAELQDILWDQKSDYFLLDLWVNMEHFKDTERGFSIKWDADLDMRFDTRQKVTAYDIIEQYWLEKLSNMFNIYGDFSLKFANLMASEILNHRKKTKIKTTWDLKQILKQIWLNEKKIAVVFQCIRIEVNKELDELKTFLERFPNYINKNGVCAVITYHSIEDTIVKYAFKNLVETWKFELINKHVIKPTYQEILRNKASRSAKLRLIKSL